MSGASAAAAVVAVASIRSHGESNDTPALQDQMSGNSRLWVALERVIKGQPRNEQEALEQVRPLLDLADLHEARQEILKALCTEEPAHFAMDGVRAAAFNALEPYLSDPRIALVMLAEIESDTPREAAMKAAVRIINKPSKVGDQEFADRTAELFLNRADNGRFTDRLQEFSPRLALTPQAKLVEALKEKATDYFTSSLPAECRMWLKGLALTNDRGAVALLGKIARQKIKRPIPDSVPDLSDSELEGLMTAGFLLCGLGTGIPVGVATHPLFGFLAGIGAGVVGVFAFAYGSDIIRRIFDPHRVVKNIGVSVEAVRALQFADCNSLGRNTLIDLYEAKKLPPAVLAAVQETIAALNIPTSLAQSLKVLKSDYVDLRCSALRNIALHKGTRADSALQSATTDRDLRVRRLAFELIKERAGRNVK